MSQSVLAAGETGFEADSHCGANNKGCRGCLPQEVSNVDGAEMLFSDTGRRKV